MIQVESRLKVADNSGAISSVMYTGTCLLPSWKLRSSASAFRRSKESEN